MNVRHLAAIALTCVFAFAAHADNQDLEQYDKAVLIQLIKNQQVKIKQLEQQIAALEKKLAGDEQPEERPDIEPDNTNAPTGFGAIIGKMPSRLIPKEGEHWADYIDEANKWLAQNAAGQRFSTQRREGQTFGVRGATWEDGRGLVFLNQAIREPQYAVGPGGRGTVRNGDRWGKMMIQVNRDVQIELMTLRFDVTERDLFMQLRAYAGTPKTFTVTGRIKQALMHGDDGKLTIVLEDNPVITDSKIEWKPLGNDEWPKPEPLR